MINKDDQVTLIINFFRRNKLTACIIVFVIIVGGGAYFLRSVVDIRDAWNRVINESESKSVNDQPNSQQGEEEATSPDTTQDLRKNPDSSTVISPEGQEKKSRIDYVTHMAPKTYSIRFLSQPQGADIYINGKLTNSVTPCKIDLPGDSSYNVMFVLNGFKPVRKTIRVPDMQQVQAIFKLL